MHQAAVGVESTDSKVRNSSWARAEPHVRASANVAMTIPGQNRMAAGIAPMRFTAMNRPSALIAPSMSLSRAKKEYAKKTTLR